MSTPAGSEPLCLFRCRGQALAVGLEHVAEVIEVGDLVRVPLCPPLILGFHSLRREIVPLVQFMQEQEGTTSGEPIGTALIFRNDHGYWGLPIHREGVEVVEPGLVGARPSEPSGQHGFATILGGLEWEGRTHTILDLERTWNRLRQEVEQWYRLIQGQVELVDSQ